ncbi:hypothetical protein DL89DRAFT_287351 [Linderina pennispora]|uniref:Uncharacterized protein n=1 Tax=Linderina pennispora TaxID=61395 RepID=A0A1Y1VV88_9FUNG|nr:uncharacterized protein DL89DRAFT_287351 [Linderina pennispora]ORX65192.1 hypothetical protein DL89DRAFT_287351 [Linderina pennispora]
MDIYNKNICCILAEVGLNLGRFSFYQNLIDKNIVFYTSEEKLKRQNKLFFYIKINRYYCEFISDLGIFRCDLKDRVDALYKIRGRKEVFKAIVENYPEYKRIESNLYIYSRNNVSKDINIPEGFMVVSSIDESLLDNPILCGGIYILWDNDNIQMVDYYTNKKYNIKEEDISYIFELNFNNNFSAEECYNYVAAYKERLKAEEEYKEDTLSMYSFTSSSCEAEF